MKTILKIKRLLALSKILLLFFLILYLSSCTKEEESFTGKYLVGDFIAHDTFLDPLDSNKIYFTTDYDVVFTKDGHMIAKYRHIDSEDDFEWYMNALTKKFFVKDFSFFGPIEYDILQLERNNLKLSGRKVVRLSTSYKTFNQILKMERKQ